ncbi:MAG: carboxypeptidase M32, partial [Actinobacteria bacterium]|nr:carboxypeptidase M32 [Actinomycetota bacterium]
MADALEQLKSRLTDLHGLGDIAFLLGWDQRTIMPAAGTGHRAQHLALLQRLAHEKLTDPEIGRLLDDIDVDSLDHDSDDWGLVRLARRTYDKAVQVPVALRGEMALASAEANPVWVRAKETSDFAMFLEPLERNVALRHEYVECFEPQEEPYDVLLDDFEPEMKTADVSRIFDEIKAELVPLIAEVRDREVDDSFLVGHFPLDRQIALDHEVVDMFGHRPDTWRIDPTEHPFASGAGIDDIRITTHYYEDSLKSLFSTMHEYGHGLYEHQIPRRFAHLPIGTGCSLGLHESQSRM